MRKIIIANWKMNGSLDFIQSFIPPLKTALSSTLNHIIICPPFPLLMPLKSELDGTRATLGAQNCYIPPQGAFTGEVSAAMLADIGCETVIVGHSERRTLFSESDDDVNAKATAIHNCNMTAILCVGENLAIRKSGHALETVKQQLFASLPQTATPNNTIIAYEPVWSIGSGLTASHQEISQMHEALSHSLQGSFPILYGGSVTEQNAQDILTLPFVDGVLVGGASLKIDSFQKIIS